MTFSDLAEDALGVCMDALGDDVTYTPAGGSATAIRGIFSETSERFDGTGVPIRMDRPNLGVRLSDLGQAPKRGDSVSVRGTAYKVSEIEKDGEGGATLYLQLV